MKVNRLFLVIIFNLILWGCETKNKNHSNKNKINIEETNSVKNNNFDCLDKPELKEYVSSEVTNFSNGSKIYRQFNCDSSWIVFEKNKIKKNIYKLDKDLIEYSNKLGFVEWIEHKNSILITEKLRSGTDSEYEYVLLDKENGSVIANLGRLLFENKDKNFPFLVTINAEKPNQLIFTNLNNNKSFKSFFDNSNFKKALKFDTYQFLPENLFENPVYLNNQFQIDYKYKFKENESWKLHKVVISLKAENFN